MRTFVATLILLIMTAMPAPAQQASQPAAAAGGKKKLVCITQSVGFEHDVVKQKDGQPSVVDAKIRSIATSLGLDYEHTRDASVLTAEKLEQTAVLVMYTTSKADKHLPMKPEDLDAWVNDGGLLLGIHPATDTFHGVPLFQKLIGGEFEAHPWNAKDTVTIKVLDANHPAAKPWADAGAEGLTFKEEIYQHKNFDPANVRVILGLDMEKTAIKRPQFIPIAWCKQQGKGRVFYTSLGHRDDVWSNPRHTMHLRSAMQWLLGDVEGDATPNPDVSAKEEEIAKKAAPPEKPKEPEKQAAAADQPKQTVPAGFAPLRVFAKAPDIKSPASIAVAPDSPPRVFVAEDEYNTQPKRDPGLSRVKLCIDTDNDGAADRFTVFADKLNSPQGMTYVGGTLYVVHAPYLTAFRDTSGDGVADTRADLVTGLGPEPQGLVHHVPSGLHMGIDGWLYISFGDKGIAKATGADGRTVTHYGGGVVRVRPDGTMLELFSTHTRNTYDVAVDPLLNAFTRDNTNDGNGWDSRLTQMQRGGEYGYPSLFKNWPDEIIAPVGSYGSGSACGAMYLSEPGFPGTFGESLYTTDWARGILYRHVLTRRGAGFEATQEEVLADVRATDVEHDGEQRIYLADWGRRDWNDSGPVGTIYALEPLTATSTTQPALARKPFPDVTKLADDALVAALASPSAVLRLEAQREILRRGPSRKASGALTNLAMKKGDLHGRVAALFTLKQLDGDASHGALATLAQAPELREFALRALADRDDQRYGVNANLFTGALKDPNPRVRAQAAIGIGQLNQPGLAAPLIGAIADTDPLVRHAAMQALRKLRARDACVAALRNPDAQVVAGALRTLRAFHDDATVNAIASLYTASAPPAVKQEIVRTLAKLYHVESKWDGRHWWTPHPDTRGPFYAHEAWSQSPRVADLMLRAAQDADVATAKLALSYVGIVQMTEAVPMLTRALAAGGGLRDEQAKALIAIKATTPDALAAMERVVLGDAYHADVRAAAAESLAAIDAVKSQPILIRLLAQLDRAPKPPPGLLEKVADALAGRATPPEMTNALVPLLGAIKQPVRVAAATSLLRSGDARVREQVTRTWESSDAARVEALLLAVPRLPVEQGGVYNKLIHARLRDERKPLRQAATIALGHLGDPSAATDLMQIASRESRGASGDPLPAVSALAGIDPARTADDQLVLIATLLVDTSAKVQKTDKDVYVRLVGAAQKFLSDPRIPLPKATSLRSRLMEPGVIYNYLRTEPIALPPNLERPLTHAFPPEPPANVTATPFSIDGKEMTWQPLTVGDPKGKHEFTMPADYVMYFSATYTSPDACTGWLTAGSDDALRVWVNGKLVHEKAQDRGLTADIDKATVPLKAGANAVLLKVYNRTGPAGVQARIRTRAAELETSELLRATGRITTPDAVAKGRALFDSLACSKCHTIEKGAEPKGPFLGDAGGKLDAKHLVESIKNPNAKIAQGFATERIETRARPGAETPGLAADGAKPGASAPGPASPRAPVPGSSPDGDHTGFVTKETATEVHLRDLTGRVTVIAKSDIARRTPLPGSMMPTGLADAVSLDDFSALLAFLSSLR